MATAAPHVKLLRQLASAKDDYLSGAFDISWDGAKATLYLVFGRPSHAVFETDEAQIEGEAAIDALLAALPRVFAVSDWRRAMSPHETLSITIDELAGPFVRLAGSYADDPVTEEAPEWWSAVDDSPDLPFGLADFPLLPGGRPLWVEASPDEVRLSERLAELPPSILILTGAKLRAAAVVSGGDLIDAVWIDSDDHARGETAGMALLGATKGSLAGYALDDPRVAEALTMLWRLPVAVSGVEMSWLDPASMLAAFRGDGLDRVLVIDAPVRGIALFSRGGLVAVYSETQRSAVASPERLRSLLSQARGRLTVMERKPRPLAADVAAKPASAHDFFDVAATEPAAAAESAAAMAGDVDADAEPEAAHAPEATADADAEPEAAQDAAHEPDASAGVEAEAASDADAEAVPAAAAPWSFRTAEASETASDPEAAAETATEASSFGSDAAVEGIEEAEPAAEAHDALTTLPPPPPDEEGSTEATTAPPPPLPAPEAAGPVQKSKRSRWTFRKALKSRADRRAAEELAAAVSDISEETGEAATFAGWSVRQQNADPQPVWLRSHDVSDAPAPPPDTEVAATDEPAPTWSLARIEEDAPAEAHTPDAAGASVEDAAPSAESDAATALSLYLAPQPAVVDDPPSSDENPHGHLDVITDGDTSAHDDHETIDDHVAQYLPPNDDEAASDDQSAHIETAPPEDTAAQDESASEPAEGGHPLELDALDEPTAEHETDATPQAWLSASWLDDVVSGDGPATSEAEAPPPDDTSAPDDVQPDSDMESIAAEQEHDDPDAEAAKPGPLFRTPGPWSWPLAESDDDTRTTGPPPVSTDDHDTEDREPAAVAASGHEETAAAFDTSESGFFHRDEPLGSQYVDFDEVRNELVQIGIVWLGESNAVQVTALLNSTRPTIDDFVATIDTIRGLHVDGQDPASIQAMAREMHQQAAERLCGA